MSRFQFISDPFLITRIKKYLEKNSNIKKVNIMKMAEELQAQYRDYSRRKRGPFRSSVRKAYEYIISESNCYIQKADNDEIHDINDSDDVNKQQTINVTEASSKYPEDSIIFEDESNKKPKNAGNVSFDDLSIVSKQESKNPIFKVNKAGSSNKQELGSVEYSAVTLNNFCCNNKIKEQIEEYMFDFKYHFSNQHHLDVGPLGGLLIYGPVGCGKTMLAKAIAGELKYPIVITNARDLNAEVKGKTKKLFNSLFNQAISLAPCVLLIENLDRVGITDGKIQRSVPMDFVESLSNCIDELLNISNDVLLVATTKEIDIFRSDFCRPDRFSDQISLGIPDVTIRKDILKFFTQDLNVAEDVDFDQISHITPGFTGIDLKKLIHEAKKLVVQRSMKSKNEKETENQVCLTNSDFINASAVVQPEVKLEGFASIPDITWDDVGSLVNIREELQLSLLGPIKYPNLLKTAGNLKSEGILLFGPPGCGKTLLAKAIANEGRLNFLSVNGPEIFNMYVGESERAIRLIFQRAFDASPCVIFFDEIDSICPRRSNSGENGGVQDRVVNQLLTEMDGVRGNRAGVYLLGATNRPDKVDPAILRHGRISNIIYIGIPTVDDKKKILRTLVKKAPPLAIDIDLNLLATDKRCEGLSGADLNQLVDVATKFALKDVICGVTNEPLFLTSQHFDKAFSKVRRSVSEAVSRKLSAFKKTFIRAIA